MNRRNLEKIHKKFDAMTNSQHFLTYSWCKSVFLYSLSVNQLKNKMIINPPIGFFWIILCLKSSCTGLISFFECCRSRRSFKDRKITWKVKVAKKAVICVVRGTKFARLVAYQQWISIKCYDFLGSISACVLTIHFVNRNVKRLFWRFLCCVAVIPILIFNKTN